MHTRKKKSLTITFLVVLFILFLSFIEAPYNPTGFASIHETVSLPQLILRKNNTPGFPENSLIAIEKALELPADGIEVDVQLSKDGIPIVFHGEKAEEYTNGTGFINKLEAKELSQFRYLQAGELTKHTIIDLEKVFHTVGTHKWLFLDIKDASIKNSGLADTIAELIRKHNLYQTVVVESFNPFFLYYLRQADPKIRIMWDFTTQATTQSEEESAHLKHIPWLLKQPWVQKQVRRFLRPDILGPYFSVPPFIIQKLSAQGYPLISWPVNDALIASQLMEDGVWGIQTNDSLKMSSSLKDLTKLQATDAGQSKSKVDQIFYPRTKEDIQETLNLAHLSNKKITIAGARHSMGGHTFSPNQIVLNMTSFDKILDYNPSDQTLTVESGARWIDVLEFLNKQGRSIKVMQSDTVFTVGGSLSANVHGWQAKSKPFSSTVVSFHLMLTNGKIINCSRSENVDLFKGAIGGYGLLGIVLDVTLQTIPNAEMKKETIHFPAKEWKEQFETHVWNKQNVQMAYGRFSVDKEHLLTEATLNTFEVIQPETASTAPLSQESIVPLKRLVFRLSELANIGKKIRWILERNIIPLLERHQAPRNTFMNADIHVLWPFRKHNVDILQEYFIPYDQTSSFLESLRHLIQKHDMNLLNVTARQVEKDDETILAYANKGVFSFVLLLSQPNHDTGQKQMEIFTKELINTIQPWGGSFYLPYCLHYSYEQFIKSYAKAPDLLALKKKYDPSMLLSSLFFEHITQKNIQ